MEPSVILFREGHPIVSFRLVVGRVAVKEGSFPVVLPDDLGKVPVFHHYIRKTSGTLPDQVEKPAQIAWLAAKGRAGAAEAVTDEFKIICRPSNIPVFRPLQQQLPKDIGLGQWEVSLGELKLFLQILVREFLLLKKAEQRGKIIPGMQRQEFQFLDQPHRAVFHTEHEIVQIAVEVVINLRATFPQRAVQHYRAAPAEYVNETAVLAGGQLVNDP